MKFRAILIIITLITFGISEDDIIDSPIFDDRAGSKSQSLQEIKNNLEILEKAKNQKPGLKYIKHILSNFLVHLKRNKRKIQSNEAKHNTGIKDETKWNKWTDWSVCSVTCGKGRVIRWRHCREHCDDIETEMEEMTCQLPECPRKLFGLIKLHK